jgi:hypothetical protein
VKCGEAEFRQMRAEFIGAKTTKDLGRVAKTFLRHNKQRSEELRLHLADPARHPRPVSAPFDRLNQISIGLAHRANALACGFHPSRRPEIVSQ